MSECAMQSPMSRGFSRRPFGELTNNWSCNAQPMATPVKETTGSPQEEALTPMANLKMLIRVAAEKDQLPSKRELFRDSELRDEPADLSMKKSTSLDHDYWTSTSGHQENLTPSSADKDLNSMLGPPKVSRKEKSLGLLCEKFIGRFPEAVPDGDRCEIPLDDLAKSMSTERRRIYDIVNVLEAVQMMTKVGKNLYQWHGRTHWLTTLARLKQYAIKLSFVDRYNEVKHTEETDPGYSSYSVSPPVSGGTPKSISPFTPTYSPCSSSSGPSPSPAERKTSLGVACQKFLMLFLIAPEHDAKINLEFAARVIHGPVLPEAVMKTRIRRLYDIANILQSLKLIKKVQVTEANGGKKPAFQYTGPDVDRVELSQEVLEKMPSSRQRNSLFAAGRTLNIPDEDDYQSMPISYKKRFDISEDFGFQQRENKVPRMKEAVEEMPQNLSKKSLVDLSFACQNERRHLVERTMSTSHPFASFNSTHLISRSASFPINRPSAGVKFIPVRPSGLDGPGYLGPSQNRTVITLVSPTNSGSNCYPAVQTSPVSLVVKKTLK